MPENTNPADCGGADVTYSRNDIRNISTNTSDFNLGFETLVSLANNHLGHYDAACPLCGPGCKTAANRKRRVLRVYRVDGGFLTYVCARCEAKGFAHKQGQSRVVDHDTLRHAHAKAEAVDQAEKTKQIGKARYFWGRSEPLAGTQVETYLRDARRIPGDPPPTLRFLRPQKAGHHPAMIAAFGVPTELEPSAYAILKPSEITGIHLTLLRADGLAKASTGDMPNKIMIGSSKGWPLSLVPPNDGLGLAIAEGIEDALSIHAVTGLGAWAAGSAGRLPELAERVPHWIESATIAVDDNQVGRTNSRSLAEKLNARGVEVLLWEGGHA